ncbi:cobalt-precorrin-6A reductase [Maricurvus nonylphenolicus]|uniref:precorrin-6A/cobalt-precorrin-6A reductase n=1 Tax=Maricurvus nonylphenolicus TaxID=1008307 RepID=UPI0036F27347
MNKRILLLGGTADARHLATELHHCGIPIIYSVAGLVRTPDISCEVISGGFSQHGGLQRFVLDQQVVGIIDVTHPYAATMTETAFEVTRKLGLPFWRFNRPAWQKKANDHWQEFSSWESLTVALAGKSSVFFTAGQLPSEVLAPLAEMAATGQRQLLRTAVKPKHEISEAMQWLKAIGPFDYANEDTLFEQHKIDVLVSKNSGGDSTRAKLDVARERGVEVFMLSRPQEPEAINPYSELTVCRDDVLQWFHQHQINDHQWM